MRIEGLGFDSTTYEVLYRENLNMLEVRFQVLTVADIKMAVFWVVAPCGLVEVY
jgi:hypothetical protein